jgi:adenylate cyclase
MIDSLFGKEEAVIRTGNEFLLARHDENTLVEAHTQLLNDYKKLFTQFTRLVRMIDRQQSELSKKSKELDIRNHFIKKAFGRYMTDEVVEQLLDSPNGLKMGGESVMVTIVMSDLRGFSAISEKLPPEAVVNMLNNYLLCMTDVIYKYSGIINDIIGDALLVVFGAPVMRSDDADRAIACALDMQLAMEAVNLCNRQQGLPDLEMGIGINTGKVVVGNIGSDMRAKYAVVGSNVNLAARVESYTVGGQVLITESTLNATTLHVNVNNNLAIPFKGVVKPVNVYDVVGVAGAYDVTLRQSDGVCSFVSVEIPLSIEILDGKCVSGEMVSGSVLSLAKKSAIIFSEVELVRFANLKVMFSDIGVEGVAYAKVVGVNVDAVNCYEVRFTFISEEVTRYLGAFLK